ncbi:hypothetical protein DRW41_02340 [Neobacillus piezotolerans]|uniref:Uncharacterized protein n=1 Tax=Neobacillus piezotolerans TaxID=2259171 RepID=A0A3D8GWZ3_9BACI|nr:hypothetical protein [Neobacillus piezotolerans]RDU38968.1 hypothetical protein DRW41_02340 [Neobacillus piezotolerans]
MKVYVLFLIQFIIWSGYTLTEWLSKHDHPLYNGLMFLVFFYLAVVIGENFIQSQRKVLFITAFSLGLYASFHIVLSYFHFPPILQK